MISVPTDRLVDDYLRRLEHAAGHLPRPRRAELVTEIREHIDSALGDRADVGEATVRNVLERLGPPEEIVAAIEPPPPEPTRAGAVEVVALIALLLPLLGWLLGAVLVLVSRAWSTRDKVIGLTLLFLPVVVFALAFSLRGPSGIPEQGSPGAEPSAGITEESPGGVIGPVELLVIVANGVPSALYLGWRLRPDRRTSPARR